MKKLVKRVLIYLSLGIGVSVVGLLLIPAGVLVVLVSLVWRTTDKLVRMLSIAGDV